MKYYIYKVEKIEDFKNEAATLDHNYNKEFEEIKALCGYIKIDYYITDTENLVDGNVYCCGKSLIKAIECVGSFENDPITIKPIN
jgi:hypothetical protein